MGATPGTEKEHVQGQGKSTGLAALCRLPRLSCNPKFSHLPSRDLLPHPSSGDAPSPASHTADRLSGAGPRNRHTKGRQPSLATGGPKFASFPFPSLQKRRRWQGRGGMQGDRPVTGQHISKAQDSGIF